MKLDVSLYATRLQWLSFEASPRLRLLRGAQEMVSVLLPPFRRQRFSNRLQHLHLIRFFPFRQSLCFNFLFWIYVLVKTNNKYFLMTLKCSKTVFCLLPKQKIKIILGLVIDDLGSLMRADSVGQKKLCTKALAQSAHLFFLNTGYDHNESFQCEALM